MIEALYIFLTNTRDDVLAIHAYGVNPRNKEDLSQLYDYNLFQGHDAKITARRKYNEIFTCEFQLKMYPFDSQVCEMSFHLVQHQKSSVFLSTECPWEIPLKRDTTVGEFRITKIEGKNLIECTHTNEFVCNCLRKCVCEFAKFLPKSQIRTCAEKYVQCACGYSRKFMHTNILLRINQ